MFPKMYPKLYYCVINLLVTHNIYIYIYIFFFKNLAITNSLDRSIGINPTSWIDLINLVHVLYIVNVLSMLPF